MPDKGRTEITTLALLPPMVDKKTIKLRRIGAHLLHVLRYKTMNKYIQVHNNPHTLKEHGMFKDQ